VTLEAVQPGPEGTGEVEVALVVRPSGKEARLVLAGWRSVAPRDAGGAMRPPDAEVAIAAGRERLVHGVLSFGTTEDVEPPVWFGVRDSAGTWAAEPIEVKRSALGNWELPRDRPNCFPTLTVQRSRVTEPKKSIFEMWESREEQRRACD
jgi:hypothetical protein